MKVKLTVHFRPPGGGAGTAAAVAGMTGGRRCRPGRNFTLLGRRHAASAQSLVPGSCHSRPSFGQISFRVPARRKRLPLDWKNLQRRQFVCPCSASDPWRLNCQIHSPGFGGSSKGSGWKLTEHDPPPKPGRRVARGPPTRRGRRGQVASPPPESPPAAPEPCRVRSGRGWKGWAEV